MIEIENLAVRAGSFVLKNVSLSIPSGEYAALMGRTGSGKTTLLETICGLRAAYGGRVRLNGRDVTRETPATRGIGYVPQDRALFLTMSVAEHLAFALSIRRRPQKEIEQRVEELAALLGLRALLHRRPHNLSGGEQQRVALGRALAASPALLLLDEPLSSLDDDTRSEMYAVLSAIRKHSGVTVLHVTHSRTEARTMATRIYVLEQQQLTEHPELLKIERGGTTSQSFVENHS